MLTGIPDAQVAGFAPTAAGGAYEQSWLVSNVHGKEAPLCMASPLAVSASARNAGGAAVAAAAARRPFAVALSQRKEARCFDGSGREIALLEPNSLANYGLSVSGDGRFVAVASFTAEVKVWELKWSAEGGCKGVLFIRYNGPLYVQCML